MHMIPGKYYQDTAVFHFLLDFEFMPYSDGQLTGGCPIL